MRRAPLPSTVAAAEDRIRHESNEHAFIVHDSGKIEAYFGSDKKDQVELSHDVDFHNKIFVHNHPSGNAFSPADIAVAVHHNMREMRAVTADGTYSMKRVGDRWPKRAFLETLVNEEDRSVRQYFTRRIANGMITTDYANKQHWTSVWIRVQERVRQDSPNHAPQIAFNFEPSGKK